MKKQSNATKEFKRRARNSFKNNAGFNLIEIVLSLALVTIVLGIGTQVFVSFQSRNALDIAATTMVHSMRRAIILSRGIESDAKHGVYVDSGTVTIFTGSTYASRTAEADEIYDIGGGIAVSGTQEYVFEKFTGYPEAVGTTTLTAGTNIKDIATNEKGTINY